MNDFDFDLFQDRLKEATKMVHYDKASRVETYIDIENKEYKITIEENIETKKVND